MAAGPVRCCSWGWIPCRLTSGTTTGRDRSVARVPRRLGTCPLPPTTVRPRAGCHAAVVPPVGGPRWTGHPAGRVAVTSRRAGPRPVRTNARMPGSTLICWPPGVVRHGDGHGPRRSPPIPPMPPVATAPRAGLAPKRIDRSPTTVGGQTIAGTGMTDVVPVAWLARQTGFSLARSPRTDLTGPTGDVAPPTGVCAPTGGPGTSGLRAPKGGQPVRGRWTARHGRWTACRPAARTAPSAPTRAPSALFVVSCHGRSAVSRARSPSRIRAARSPAERP